jgi:hypothetical protein
MLGTLKPTFAHDSSRVDAFFHGKADDLESWMFSFVPLATLHNASYFFDNTNLKHIQVVRFEFPSFPAEVASMRESELMSCANLSATRCPLP